MNEIIFLNGRFVPVGQAGVSVLAPGFLYGWGLFETMRSYHRSIVYFEQHLRRLKAGCALLDIKLPYSMDKLKEFVRQAVRRSAFGDNYVRLAVWKGLSKAEVMILVKRYAPYSSSKYRQGFRCLASSFRQNEKSLLARIKTNNRLLYQRAYEEAREKGFDEALLLNTSGQLAEASRSNIFFVKGARVFTPSLSSGCLEGVTRQAVFDLCEKHGVKVCQGKFVLRDLFNAEGAFLTNSGMGIMPLRSVNKRVIGSGRQSKIIKLLAGEYQKLLKNED